MRDVVAVLVVILVLGQTSGVNGQGCNVMNTFTGPISPVCNQEYLEGQQPGATGCFRTPNCLGIDCMIAAIPYTFRGTYMACNATLAAALLGPEGTPVVSVIAPIDGFTMEFGVVSVTVTVLDTNAAYCKFEIVFTVLSILPITMGPFEFGDANCIWDKAYCYRTWVIVGLAGLGALLIALFICLICCCCCRQGKRKNTYLMVEPLLSTQYSTLQDDLEEKV